MTGLAFALPTRVEKSVRDIVAATKASSAPTGPLAYFEALNCVQPYAISLNDIGEFDGPPKATYQFDQPEDRRALEHFLEGEKVGSTHIYSPTERNEIYARYTAGFRVLADFDSDASTLAEMIVARVFFANKAGFGGASVGDMLGCIWLSPPRSWTPVDFAEAIYHETIHQALFLEEMVHGVYAVDAATMARPEGRVVSAIRREERPFGASFHAACVAAALIDLFRSLELASRVEGLVEGLEPSVKAMRRKDGYLNDRGKMILGELELRAG